MNLPVLSRKSKIMLLVLLGAVVFVAIVSGDAFRRSIRHSRESVLKRDLLEMRTAIDRYTLDKQRPPESLQVLVDKEYLPGIPKNPFTHKADWVPNYVNVELDGGQSSIGIDDVHATAPYSDW